METVKLALTATSASEYAVRTVTAVKYESYSYFSKQLVLLEAINFDQTRPPILACRFALHKSTNTALLYL